MKRLSVSPACSGLLLSVVRAKDIDRQLWPPGAQQRWRRGGAQQQM